MSNMRRLTNGLDTDQVKELNYAWHHAGRIGRPLNVMISVRPIDIDETTTADRCRMLAALRNKLGVYTRLRGFEPTFVWSREVNPDGTGEHLHVLMHVPAKHRSDFEATLFGWYPGPAEADVRKADQRTRFTWNGKRHSAIGYICKQMTPQAWYGRGLTRKAGGPILGKRGGTTKNLDRRARAAFRAFRPAYNNQRPKFSTSARDAKHAPGRAGSRANLRRCRTAAAGCTAGSRRARRRGIGTH
jgi:hypothetical protein